MRIRSHQEGQTDGSMRQRRQYVPVFLGERTLKTIVFFGYVLPLALYYENRSVTPKSIWTLKLNFNMYECHCTIQQIYQKN